MTPKEKAEDIFTKMYMSHPNHKSLGSDLAFKSALLAIEEIINLLCHLELIEELKFWEEVKRQLKTI